MHDLSRECLEETESDTEKARISVQECGERFASDETCIYPFDSPLCCFFHMPSERTVVLHLMHWATLPYCTLPLPPTPVARIGQQHGHQFTFSSSQAPSAVTPAPLNFVGCLSIIGHQAFLECKMSWTGKSQWMVFQHRASFWGLTSKLLSKVDSTQRTVGYVCQQVRVWSRGKTGWCVYVYLGW